jgi:lipopolysaccharide transport system ATP-binding protein
MWALKDVSFTVKEGEVLGIIGRNGAGKSTLLKLLTRITEPTSGRALVYGRVASLLEVGTGFHPELTGRENIYLNGAVLGMKRAEVAHKFDEIVAFSEVEQFLDTPVKRYSSGMYVRLAFAVAAHLDPEILLVDEVLAVGDAAFQKKCLGKMSEVAQSGRTVLFVSHNMAAIRKLCTRAVLLDAGSVFSEGDPGRTVDDYLGSGQCDIVDIGSRSDRQGTGDMKFVSVRLRSGDAEVVAAQTGRELTVCLGYTRRGDSSPLASVRMAFSDRHDQRLFMCLSTVSHGGYLRLGDRGEIRCTMPKLPLIPGRYSVDVWCKLDAVMADNIPSAFILDVTHGDFHGCSIETPSDGGSMLVWHNWDVV